MTRTGMAQTILNHWKTHHAKSISQWTEDEQREQALARAMLVEAEMTTLMEIGVDRTTAWTDLKNTMALAKPA